MLVKKLFLKKSIVNELGKEKIRKLYISFYIYLYVANVH